MLSILFFLSLFTLPQIHGIFLLNSDSSSIIVIRHLRLMTDNEYYRIRCPYHLKHLTVTLLNYSNDHCFDLHTKSIDHYCIRYRSPCWFHAKSVRLTCPNQPDSNHVDITYQCSSSRSTNISTTFNEEDEASFSSNPSSELITLHALSFPSKSFGMEETIGIFLIALTAVSILWLTVCCVWFIRCDHRRAEDDSKCELIAIRPCYNSDTTDVTIVSERKPMIVGNLSGHTSTGGIDNVCLHVNPLENQPFSSSSSLKITQID